MISDTDKRQASLSILQRLRRQGLPQREERMESMFDSLIASEGEPEEDSGEEPSYEMQSPEEQEKERAEVKGPKLGQKKVEKFKKGMMSVK